MKKEEIALEIEQIFARRHEYVQEKKNRPVVGYMCKLTPVEIILAGGAMPIELFGDRRRAELADTCVGATVCPFARSILEDALKGKYGYLDAVSIPHSCDIVTKIFDLWRECVSEKKEMYQIYIPHVVNKNAVDELIIELKEQAKWMKKVTGVEITAEKLTEAVKLANKSRQMLRKLHQLCEETKLQGSAFMAAVLCRGIMDTEEWNGYAEKLISSAMNKKINVKARLFMSAAAIEDLQLVEMIESFGGSVVVHEYCDGLRSCHKDIEEIGDPWYNIAKFYMEETMCQRFYDPGKRFDFIDETLKRVPVDGVITYALSNCDCFLLEEVAFIEKFKSMDIPALALHVNYEAQQNEQMMTRVEAFMEMVKRRKR